MGPPVPPGPGIRASGLARCDRVPFGGPRWPGCPGSTEGSSGAMAGVRRATRRGIRTETAVPTVRIDRVSQHDRALAARHRTDARAIARAYGHRHPAGAGRWTVVGIPDAREP